MAFEFTAVTAHIKSLSITGYLPNGASKAVKVLDYDGITDAADQRQCPILQPDVTQQITFESFARDSFGDGATAKQTLYYNLPYVLLYAPVGSERGLQTVLPNMARTLSAIVTAFIVNDTPSDASVDLQIAGFTFGQIVSDPSGVAFHGAAINVMVREFVN